MNKKLIFIYIFIILFFTSCWDKTEIENRSFILAIGIDKDENTKNIFKITTIEPNLNALQQKSTESNKRVKIGKKETLLASINEINSYSSNKNYLGHTKLIVLSKSILEDKEMFKQVLDTLGRNREISKKVLILSTTSSANKLLSINIDNEPMLGIFVSKFYRNNNLGTSFKKDLDSLIKDMRIKKSSILPKAEIEGKNIKLSGAVVLKDYKLKGLLNEKETRGYMWLKGSTKGANIISYNKNLEPLTFVVDSNKKNIKFINKYNNYLTVVSNIHVKGNLESYIFNKTDIEKNNEIEKLCNMFENTIKEEIESTLELFKKLEIDGFEFFEILKKKNYKEYLKFKNKEKLYKNIDNYVNVTLEIIGIGDIN